MFSNCSLISAVLTFAIAQSIKVFTTWYKENRWDARQLVGSGGMLSSHSATITTLTIVVGLQEGFASSLFATAAIFAFLKLSRRRLALALLRSDVLQPRRWKKQREQRKFLHLYCSQEDV